MALTPNPVGTGKDWHTGRQHSPVRFPRATFPDSLLICRWSTAGHVPLKPSQMDKA